MNLSSIKRKATDNCPLPFHCIWCGGLLVFSSAPGPLSEQRYFGESNPALSAALPLPVLLAAARQPSAGDPQPSAVLPAFSPSPLPPAHPSRNGKPASDQVPVLL